MRCICFLIAVSFIACAEISESANSSEDPEVTSTSAYTQAKRPEREHTGLITSGLLVTAGQLELAPTADMPENITQRRAEELRPHYESSFEPIVGHASTALGTPGHDHDKDHSTSDELVATDDVTMEPSHGDYFVGLVPENPKHASLAVAYDEGTLHLRGSVIRRNKGTIDWNYGRGIGMAHSSWVARSTHDDSTVLVIEDSDGHQWHLGFSIPGVQHIHEGAFIEVQYNESAQEMQTLEVYVEGELKMTTIEGTELDTSNHDIKIQPGEKLNVGERRRACEKQSHILHLTQGHKNVRLLPSESHSIDEQVVTFGAWLEPGEGATCDEMTRVVRLAIAN